VIVVRLLFIGDSITLGLGASGEAFPAVIERKLRALRGPDVHVWNASINGGTVGAHLDQLQSYIEYRATVACLFIGNIDAIPVPRRDGWIDLVRWLPGRYRRPGWLQPRPYLPSRLWKRYLYAIPESFLRTKINQVLVRAQGATSPTPVSRFRTELQTMLGELTTNGVTCIVCGLGPIDNRMFPASEVAFREYRSAIEAEARAANAHYVDVESLFDGARDHRDGLLLLDNFHPNAAGHQVIANALYSQIADALGRGGVEASEG
jgi:lysophospholipase L1-like esterase